MWDRLPHKALFGILLVAWIALFHFFGNATMGWSKTNSIFQWAHSIYISREDESHGTYIPFLVLLFFWVRRRELTCSSVGIWWPALGYFLLAVAMHAMAYRVQQARISVLAVILGFHALIGLVWGREALRRSIFPVFLLLFCIPMGSIADIITLDLRLLVTKISVGFSHHGLGIAVFRDGSQIFNGAGQPMYDVAPACSGMRSLVAMSALSVIYAFLNFDTPWKRAALIASALPLAVFANIVRITTVILVGDTFGHKWGVFIEQKFGFITFAIALAGMMGIGRLIREPSNAQAPAPVQSLETNPA